MKSRRPSRRESMYCCPVLIAMSVPSPTRRPPENVGDGTAWPPRLNLECSTSEHREHMHRSVRSLSRGLALIRELNVTGPAGAQQLARRTGLNRTTCYRLLQTLQEGGFVSFDQKSALFALTARVRMLSEGVSTQDLSSQAALPPMFDLLKAVSWPSDFAVFELGAMVIRESTH